jgi:4-hydroxybenzoate polyprenyltransferase
MMLRLIRRLPPKSQAYCELMRVETPIGSWLLYWPGAWSIALATADVGHIDWETGKLLALFGVGSVTMRAAGCIVNDMWDRDIDVRVARTRSRPLASGRLTMTDASVALASCLTVSLGVLAQLNDFSKVLALSSVALVAVYPLAKRVTYWPQAVLASCFNWGAMLGYAAVHGHLDVAVVAPLYVAGVCWTLTFDTIYAHQDKADDAIVGVKSTALRFGADTKQWLAGFATVMVGSLGAAGIAAAASPLALGAGLSAVAAHLAWQIGTVDIDNADDCGRKFRSNAWLGLLVFLALILSTRPFVGQAQCGKVHGEGEPERFQTPSERRIRIQKYS